MEIIILQNEEFEAGERVISIVLQISSDKTLGPQPFIGMVERWGGNRGRMEDIGRIYILIWCRKLYLPSLLGQKGLKNIDTDQLPQNVTYRIQPNYCTVRLGFSTILGKLVKYVPYYTKDTH